ncbi:antibiotic biosynthesis monooxygenase [Modestobacter versicolor]|uniref:antibiotic biosynthesis monooxygenase n=1 Tax=Modestobacter versicolor TaxID=429133 RepID=UPI0034DFAA6A
MILRLWRGWTDPDRTASYQELLTGRIAPGILARDVPGLHDLAVLRRAAVDGGAGPGTEFLTAMTFTDLSAVAAFTGGDPRTSVVPPEARALLSRFDEHSRHYTTVQRFGS